MNFKLGWNNWIRHYAGGGRSWKVTLHKLLLLFTLIWISQKWLYGYLSSRECASFCHSKHSIHLNKERWQSFWETEKNHAHTPNFGTVEKWFLTCIFWNENSRINAHGIRCLNLFNSIHESSQNLTFSSIFFVQSYESLLVCKHVFGIVLWFSDSRFL